MGAEMRSISRKFPPEWGYFHDYAHRGCALTVRDIPNESRRGNEASALTTC